MRLPLTWAVGFCWILSTPLLWAQPRPVRYPPVKFPPPLPKHVPPGLLPPGKVQPPQIGGTAPVHTPAPPIVSVTPSSTVRNAAMPGMPNRGMFMLPRMLFPASQLQAMGALPLMMPATPPASMPSAYPSSALVTMPLPVNNPGSNYNSSQPPQPARVESRSEPPATESTDNKAHDPVTLLFTRLDIDKDGRISSREARGLLLEMFSRLDRNNDGYLDREELQAALQRYPGLQSK